MKTINMTPEEYAGMWGCDPVYDKPPNESGDGYLFYNFNVEGHKPEFLEKFIPAIDRTIKNVRNNPEVWNENELEELSELREICEQRLSEALGELTHIMTPDEVIAFKNAKPNYPKIPIKSCPKKT